MHLQYSNAMLLTAIFLMKNTLSNIMNDLLCVRCSVRTFRSCVLYYIIPWSLGERQDLVENGKLQECELLPVEKTGTQPQLSQV